MQFFSDRRNKLIRVNFDGAVDDLDSLHAFSESKAERWAARDGWQPSAISPGDILQSGWIDRIEDFEVPAEQARMRALATL